jgi:hypothetical protein
MKFKTVLFISCLLISISGFADNSPQPVEVTTVTGEKVKVTVEELNRALKISADQALSQSKIKFSNKTTKNGITVYTGITFTDDDNVDQKISTRSSADALCSLLGHSQSESLVPAGAKDIIDVAIIKKDYNSGISYTMGSERSYVKTIRCQN